ncbi:aldehyde dehydrogenase domain-containing protein [Diplogelasinospora grovesii]|uniref:aldehyde dehydrogenase (NAD(+)) n=1 Tax=Diplogelasinospora grovesii TaxID=303347 RepID=A0AAN6N3T1_9PEZI|nr:aldehyde dehydrogenase domain-containing protein [Diplogelasinospora grovesii]
MMATDIVKPRMLINGELVEASDGKTFSVYNPATRQKSAEVPEASADDTNRAVSSAKAAFPGWSALDPSVRGSYLGKLAALIRQNNDELAKLEAISMGLPVSSFHHAKSAALQFEHYAEAWPHVQGQASVNTPGHVAMTLRQPYGVVALIIPWNAPIHFFASKAAPALITGNTVVLKSSEKAPLGVARVAELVNEAGFPPGVFNILSGHGLPSGQILSRHMDVRALSFTGSSRTGKLIQEEAARTNLKRVILELGGKSPAIIFHDANLKKAVEQTQFSIQVNSGQVCMANSRIYVQKNVARVFVEAFKQRFAAVKDGDPLSKEVNHGPQADEVQYKTVMSYIEQGTKSGGTLVQGGRGKRESTSGFFVEPTVFVDTPEDARIMKEEVFGPVVNINTFETEAEVIAKANDTEYGLYAAVYTRDINRALRVAKALESGYVGVNCTSPLTGRDLPFGGYKGSGQGREGFLYSMDNFLETKSVIIQIDDA